MITIVFLGDFIFSWFFSHYWLEFFPEEKLPFFPIYLFIQLVIAVWTLGVYFPGCNRKLSLFCCSDYSAWVTGHSLWWGPGPSPIPDPFWALPYFLAPQDFSGLSSIFPASDSDIGQFFHWHLDGIAIFVVFQNEGLGGKPMTAGVPGSGTLSVQSWEHVVWTVCVHLSAHVLQAMSTCQCLCFQPQTEGSFSSYSQRLNV